MPVSTPLDLESLIARIRAEAECLEPGMAVSLDGEQALPVWPDPGAALILTPCRVEDFFWYQGREFVTIAYRTLLKRDPDPSGLQAYGGYLEKGGSRLFVLFSLRYSPEGRSWGVPLRGLGWAGGLGRFPGRRLLAPFFSLWEWGLRLHKPDLFVRSLLLERLRAQAEVGRRLAAALLARESAQTQRIQRLEEALNAKTQRAGPA
ncbi:MAG: DUF4214 domain-containing protein [Pseudomonadota bacterium]